jgi:hypothetical protein
MKIDISKLDKLIDSKYISRQKHPESDLFIYNYTPRAQFNKVWDELTMMSRGLILDEKGEIIARPFKKFFNLGEHLNEGKEIPNESFEVTQKLDGSLGILYWLDNKPFLATRGSFVSDQAVMGNKILKKYTNQLTKLDKNLTYLFEILYPENRIVVDYKGLEDIVLLATIDRQSGKEAGVDDWKDLFTVVNKVDGINDLDQLTANQKDNEEGYVITFKNGLKLKLKFEEYVRLHRIVTGVNTKRVWEHLKDNQPMDELLDRVPDEFFKWLNVTTVGLKTAYKNIEDVAKHDFKDLGDRKTNAIYYRKKKYPSVLFDMLDKRDYSSKIWKLVRPIAEKPYKVDIDA